MEHMRQPVVCRSLDLVETFLDLSSCFLVFLDFLDLLTCRRQSLLQGLGRQLCSRLVTSLLARCGQGGAGPSSHRGGGAAGSRRAFGAPEGGQRTARVGARARADSEGTETQGRDEGDGICDGLTF